MRHRILREEAGAILVLALVFVVSVGLVLLAIVSLAGTNLLDTAGLQNTRSLQYAADGGVDADLWSSPAWAAATRRNREEKDQNKRRPPDISTS